MYPNLLMMSVIVARIWKNWADFFNDPAESGKGSFFTIRPDIMTDFDIQCTPSLVRGHSQLWFAEI